MANDRFRTQWAGPGDPRAMAWAARHGISFMPTGLIMLGLRYNDGRPELVNADFGAPPGTTPHDLRAENDKYDDEVRARHAADPDLNTGTSGILDIKINWVDRTRGEKLRECKIWVETYEKALVEAQERQRRLTSSSNTPSNKKCLEMLGEYVSIMGKLVELTKNLESLVVQEVEQGWEWKEGIEKQKAVRSEMSKASDKREGFIFRAIIHGQMSSMESEDVLGVDVSEGTVVNGIIGGRDWPKGVGLE